MSAAVGKKLRQAREEQGLTLNQVAERTHIRIHYLRAMEAGQFDTIPSRVQARGFLRSYAGFLQIDTKPLFEALERDALLVLMPSDEQPESEIDPETESPASPIKAAQAGLIEAGETLRSQREMLGLSLKDVERHTHLRIHYLQALELGDMDALPSTVQGTGMLKNYATFLGLDPEPLLLRFAENLQSQLMDRRGSQTSRTRVVRKPQKTKSLRQRFFSRDVILGGSLIVFLVAFAVWAGMRIASARLAEEPEPTPPSIADVLLPSPTASLAPTATATIPSPLDEAADAEAGGPAPAETQDPFAVEEIAGAVRVQIVIRQRAYMRITVDGEVEFDGRVISGSAYAFAGDESVEILTGNGAGLYVTYNDQELGALGLYGEVRDIIFDAGGLQTPTPTISPTPTETPKTTPTLTPTPNP